MNRDQKIKALRDDIWDAHCAEVTAKMASAKAYWKAEQEKALAELNALIWKD